LHTVKNKGIAPKKSEREKLCRHRMESLKKVLPGLIISLHRVNFYDSCAGFTGIKFILPASLARPAPAENTLAQFRDRMGRRAEIAHVLGEAMGIL